MYKEDSDHRHSILKALASKRLPGKNVIHLRSTDIDEEKADGRIMDITYTNQ